MMTEALFSILCIKSGLFHMVLELKQHLTRVVVVQLLSHVFDWFDPRDCSMPGFPLHHRLPDLAQTHVHRVSDAIQRSYPLPSPSPPTFNLSQHQGLFQESVLCIRWPKYWSFSFSISPTNEYSGLISFRIGWFDLLAVQGTLKSLCQLRRYCLY